MSLDPRADPRTRFEIAAPGRVVFGDGVVRELPSILSGLMPAGAVLVATGRAPGRAAPVVELLEAGGREVRLVRAAGEPTVEAAREATVAAREAGCGAVVAVGGGSVLDLGKAVAALLANGGDPLDYLEVVGAGRALTRPSVPLVAVPTTAGTGSEVTKNAVLADARTGVKASMRSEHMLPRVALVDPELTWSMPPDVTASTGLDALTQLVEPFVSSRATPFTDALCREGLRRGAAALPAAFRDGSDRDARHDMALASVLGGLALANAGLGAVHGFAGPLGGMFPSPHGAVCARLLPIVLRVNLTALRARAPASPALARFDALGELLNGQPGARAEDAVRWAETTVAELAIARLSAYGMSAAHVPEVAAKAARASSMRGNPIVLETAELEAILAEAL